MHTDPRAGPRPVRAILLGAGVTMSDHRLSAMSTVDSKLAAADQGPPMGVSGPGLIRAVLLLSKASRAVGQANGKNPIPILIPCHRIIGADGSLGGYSSGVDIKGKLLEIETRHHA